MSEIEKKTSLLKSYSYICLLLLFLGEKFTDIQKQAKVLFPLNEDLLSLNTIDNVYAKTITTHKIIIWTVFFLLKKTHEITANDI